MTLLLCFWFILLIKHSTTQTMIAIFIAQGGHEYNYYMSAVLIWTTTDSILAIISNDSPNAVQRNQFGTECHSLSPKFIAVGSHLVHVVIIFCIPNSDSYSPFTHFCQNFDYYLRPELGSHYVLYRTKSVCRRVRKDKN